MAHIIAKRSKKVTAEKEAARVRKTLHCKKDAVTVKKTGSNWGVYLT